MLGAADDHAHAQRGGPRAVEYRLLSAGIDLDPLVRQHGRQPAPALQVGVDLRRPLRRRDVENGAGGRAQDAIVVERVRPLELPEGCGEGVVELTGVKGLRRRVAFRHQPGAKPGHRDRAVPRPYDLTLGQDGPPARCGEVGVETAPGS